MKSSMAYENHETEIRKKPDKTHLAELVQGLLARVWPCAL